ncbi:MAG: hypothetical protein AAFP90_16460, partial [Planctomycetota bacterium]
SIQRRRTKGSGKRDKAVSKERASRKNPQFSPPLQLWFPRTLTAMLFYSMVRGTLLYTSNARVGLPLRISFEFSDVPAIEVHTSPETEVKLVKPGQMANRIQSPIKPRPQAAH